MRFVADRARTNLSKRGQIHRNIHSKFAFLPLVYIGFLYYSSLEDLSIFVDSVPISFDIYPLCTGLSEIHAVERFYPGGQDTALLPAMP